MVIKVFIFGLKSFFKYGDIFNPSLRWSLAQGDSNKSNEADKNKSGNGACYDDKLF